MSLNAQAQKVHDRAVHLAKVYRRAELDLVEILIQVADFRIDRQLRYTSLYKYIIGALNICKSHAYAFDSVVRRARKIPELRQALRSGRITVSRATRLLSILNAENAEEVIAFAAEHSHRETELYVAKLRPRSAKPDRVRVLAEELFHLEGSITAGCLRKYERVKELLMSKQKEAGLNEILETALDEYLFKHDPAEKAKRAVQRQKSKGSNPVCAHRKITIRKRKPIAAETKHAVNLRDGVQCTFIDEHGRRCEERKWTHLHHVKPASHGGDNSVENLRTLCSAHHDLIHQLSLPIEGQIDWFSC